MTDDVHITAIALNGHPAELGDQTMRILLVRAPPGKRFPERFAQVVDHPYK